MMFRNPVVCVGMKMLFTTSGGNLHRRDCLGYYIFKKRSVCNKYTNTVNHIINLGNSQMHYFPFSDQPRVGRNHGA